MTSSQKTAVNIVFGAMTFGKPGTFGSLGIGVDHAVELTVA